MAAELRTEFSDVAFGISKNRTADVAWVYTDSSKKYPYASEFVIPFMHDSVNNHSFDDIKKTTSLVLGHTGKSVPSFKKWKVKTAVGGERKFLEIQSMTIIQELQ